MSNQENCSKYDGSVKKGFIHVRNNDQSILFNFVVLVEVKKITGFIETKANAPQYPVTWYKCESRGYMQFLLTRGKMETLKAINNSF